MRCRIIDRKPTHIHSYFTYRAQKWRVSVMEPGGSTLTPLQRERIILRKITGLSRQYMHSNKKFLCVASVPPQISVDSIRSSLEGVHVFFSSVCGGLVVFVFISLTLCSRSWFFWYIST